MPQPHAIRLNRAWELRWLTELPSAELNKLDLGSLISSTPTIARIDLPWAADADGEESALLLTRRFNRPSNLSLDESVFICIMPPALTQAAYFNGHRLGTPTKLESEPVEEACLISNLLGDHNRLDIVVEHVAALSEMDARLLIVASPSTV